MIPSRAIHLGLAIILTAFFAKGQPAPTKRFEIASVKPYGAEDGNFMIRTLPGGNFRAVGVTLKMLIMFAYNVKAFQISDAPGWAGIELWEIQAKASALDGPLARPDSQAMVRALLEDRYQLKIHRETRTMPVYAMVAPKRAGGKLAAATGQQAGICPCGPGLLAPDRASMGMLAAQLSTILWRVVIDKTGMKGEYAFKLQWMPVQGEYGPEALGLPPGSGAAPPPDPAVTGPSIFTALKEQAGLRLESQKGPVEIVVIDQVAKPEAN
jgi:uncharacterized protein (TIGR03435 family)